MMLGEEGTEQFTVESRVNGVTINTQKIHDPFIWNTCAMTLGRWQAFLGIFKELTIRTETIIHGSEGARRAIMTLDPAKLQADTEEILKARAYAREHFQEYGEVAEKSPGSDL